MNAPKWLKFIKEAWAFDARVKALEAGGGSSAPPTTEQVSNALKAKTQIAALTAVAVADATDATTAATLANANKGAINDLIAALKA